MTTAATPVLDSDHLPELATGVRNRVLVVDDDTNLRVMLRLALQSAGLQVVTAADGREALAMTELLHPDALVLDVMMPYLDGFAVARRLRQADHGPAILFLTARDNHSDRRSAAELGADYLTKPFRLTELIARVRALLPP